MYGTFSDYYTTMTTGHHQIPLLFLVLLLLLINSFFISVRSRCCSCPAPRCSIPQWPCCNKKSKWWHNILG
ncbi:uncharacterized protein [Drosophila bipectinata]|uniref:uncharacterized protein n=1 Tax=Drosophila bipectinata TaxID=42026 RepID=UPI001C8ACFAE|nr:uncharacterized protein LOC122321469 [Drosophila bipectinata]